MKISVNWINQLLNTSLPAEQMAEILTATGLEVEGIEIAESVPGGLKGLVTGHVLTCEKHPDADRLSLTTVDIGAGEPLQIVCGAPNVAAGQKVIVAPPGTTLYPLGGEPFQIKKSKIRGEVSEGMICAEDEIGIGNSHDGIKILPENTPIGVAAATLFNLTSDNILEIGLTPNRADAASHIGVARDLAAALTLQGHDVKVSMPEKKLTEPSKEPLITVKIESEDCIRYTGIEIMNVEVRESPEWLARLLTSLGMRPVNNIVDVTNLIMLETGQPLHAFDADKISGHKIIIKKPAPGTKFTTLDGKERTLNGAELMICDDKSELCMAGIFGGESSGVTMNTKNIFLESACFNPVSIRKSGKHHGLKTDSSFRFERGTDPNMTLAVMQRAVLMINELAAGNASNGHVDVYPEKKEPAQVTFRPENFQKLTGVKISSEKMKQILLSLGICVTSTGPEWHLEVPLYKVDVTREIDVIEEILRIYGYDNIPLQDNVSVPLETVASGNKAALRKTISNMLSGFGFMEMMNNSLTSSSYYADQENKVSLLNPLSQELNILRPDLLAGAMQIISYNRNRQQSNLHFFEFGFAYSKSDAGKYKEREQLAITSTGNRRGESWEGNEESSFFYLKGIVRSILEKAGINNLKEEEAEDNRFDWTLSISSGQKEIARIGKISAKTGKAFDIDDAVYYAELSWTDIVKLSLKSETRFTELPKSPMVRRDLALLVDKTVSYAKLEETSRKSSGRLLKNVFLFDVYEGDKLPEGKVSYAMGFEFQDPEKTLTDQQIEKVMEKLLKSLQHETGATLR